MNAAVNKCDKQKCVSYPRKRSMESRDITVIKHLPAGKSDRPYTIYNYNEESVELPPVGLDDDLSEELSSLEKFITKAQFSDLEGRKHNSLCKKNREKIKKIECKKHRCDFSKNVVNNQPSTFSTEKVPLNKSKVTGSIGSIQKPQKYVPSITKKTLKQAAVLTSSKAKPDKSRQISRLSQEAPSGQVTKRNAVDFTEKNNVTEQISLEPNASSYVKQLKAEINACTRESCKKYNDYKQTAKNLKSEISNYIFAKEDNGISVTAQRKRFDSTAMTDLKVVIRDITTKGDKIFTSCPQHHLCIHTAPPCCLNKLSTKCYFVQDESVSTENIAAPKTKVDDEEKEDHNKTFIVPSDDHENEDAAKFLSEDTDKSNDVIEIIEEVLPHGNEKDVLSEEEIGSRFLDKIGDGDGSVSTSSMLSTPQVITRDQIQLSMIDEMRNSPVFSPKSTSNELSGPSISSLMNEAELTMQKITEKILNIVNDKSLDVEPPGPLREYVDQGTSPISQLDLDNDRPCSRPCMQMKLVTTHVDAFVQAEGSRVQATTSPLLVEVRSAGTEARLEDFSTPIRNDQSCTKNKLVATQIDAFVQAEDSRGQETKETSQETVEVRNMGILARPEHFPTPVEGTTNKEKVGVSDDEKKVVEEETAEEEECGNVCTCQIDEEHVREQLSANISRLAKAIKIKQESERAYIVSDRLRIQTLPPINIKGSLVIQKIPTVVITPKESTLDRDVLTKNNRNVTYEIAKYSEEKHVADKQQEKSGGVKVKEKKHEESSIIDNEPDNGVFNPTIFFDNDSRPRSDTSSITSYDYDQKKFTVPEVKFLNQEFKDVSYSDEKSAEMHRHFDMVSVESRGAADKRNYFKDISKDPEVETIFRSYQLLSQDTLTIDDDEEKEIEFTDMDNDIYKAYVNPKGPPRCKRTFIEGTVTDIPMTYSMDKSFLQELEAHPKSESDAFKHNDEELKTLQELRRMSSQAKEKIDIVLPDLTAKTSSPINVEFSEEEISNDNDTKVSTQETPKKTDDLNFESLSVALFHQLADEQVEEQKLQRETDLFPTIMLNEDLAEKLIEIVPLNEVEQPNQVEPLTEDIVGDEIGNHSGTNSWDVSNPMKMSVTFPSIRQESISIPRIVQEKITQARDRKSDSVTRQGIGNFGIRRFQSSQRDQNWSAKSFSISPDVSKLPSNTSVNTEDVIQEIDHSKLETFQRNNLSIVADRESRRRTTLSPKPVIEKISSEYVLMRDCSAQTSLSRVQADSGIKDMSRSSKPHVRLDSFLHLSVSEQERKSTLIRSAGSIYTNSVGSAVSNFIGEKLPQPPKKINETNTADNVGIQAVPEWVERYSQTEKPHYKKNDYSVMRVEIEYPPRQENQAVLERGDVPSENIATSTRQRKSRFWQRGFSTIKHSRKQDEKNILTSMLKHKRVVENSSREVTSESESYTKSSSSRRSSSEHSTQRSEGEVRAICGASVGEMHRCLREHSSYYNRHPQELFDRELGETDMEIRRKKQYNANWVAYYFTNKKAAVSLSPSSCEEGLVESNSDDSSGLVKKK